jgi:hypothetical protein
MGAATDRLERITCSARSRPLAFGSPSGGVGLSILHFGAHSPLTAPSTMTRRFAALSAALLCTAFPSVSGAQQELPGSQSHYGVRLHVGMWTSHLSSVSKGLDANWLVAMGWRGVYGGTFVNSFGRRAFAVGIERPLARDEGGSVDAGLGYRFGLVTGYDERLIGLAAKTPVLPALQVMGDVAVGRTGLELAWAGKVATMSPFMRVAN